MDQYQRKDSVSSEVAALLCISGRTSRISSVGSQGSAASRLSAISGVSRSPSPHKMILETSFCGPKPVDMPLTSDPTRPADALEQILLARKQDPTQAVFAEGITIKDATATKNGAVVKTVRKTKSHPTHSQQQVVNPEVKITRPQVTATKLTIGSKSAATTAEHKKIVGKTENGTEYIRIKLKPDDCYDDKGLAPNEKLVDDAKAGEAIRKPVSLNIHKQTKGESGRSGSSNSGKLTASPKHIFGGGGATGGSRSPSPATVVTTSRKNSFCSLFKSKEATSTPDSPTAFQIRKKSSASARENDDAHSHRSRSCGKDMGEKLSPSPTPSKQKSVLGLFKTKRSGSASKSKSTSPVDHEERRMEAPSPVAGYYSAVHSGTGTATGSKTSASTTRLRYYETPADNTGIYIPLHTPPEEKELKVEDDAVTRYNQMLDKQLHETELGRSILRSMNKPVKTPEASPKMGQKQPAPQPDCIQTHQDEITAAPKTSPSPARKLSDQGPRIRKSSRIEYPDGSIRIPLRSPSDEDPPSVVEQVCQVQVELVPEPTPVVVVKVEKREPPEPPPRVFEVELRSQSPPAAPPPPPQVAEEVPLPGEVEEEVPEVHCAPVKVEEISSKNFKVDMVPLPPNEQIPDQQINEELPQPPPPTPASVMSIEKQPGREKKHILFTTKLGSNEEQLFQTQFSVSKTESLCSPTSEANNTQAESDANVSNEEKEKRIASAASKEKVIRQQTSSDDMGRAIDELPADTTTTTTVTMANTPSVIVQLPQAAMTRRRSSQLRCQFSTEDEMSAKDLAKVVVQQKDVKKEESAEEEKTEVVIVEVMKQQSTEAMDYKLGPQRTSTTEENAVASSGSDRDSETCTDTTTRSRKHLPHNLTIDEHESTGLVSQISYEDELPYVPTTLPEERSVGVQIISVKERATMEVKTYPVERPRSTTPLNPSFIDDYCGVEVETPTSQKGEKLKICLPRKDSRDKIQKPRSPRRVSNSSGKSWFEYEARGEPTDQFEEPPPPPLPPRAAEKSANSSTVPHATTNSPNSHSQWINFENIPEKRKPPKRITTVPQKDPPVVGGSVSTTESTNATTTTVYQFVKPDECQCECHEMERKVCGTETESPATAGSGSAEEGEPLLGSSENNATGGTTRSGADGCNSMR